MAPKKNQPARCSRSQTHLRFKYPKKLSENNFSACDYSETILHRLRPQIHRLQRVSENLCKVCKPPETRRKRTRRSVKRCFVQYRTKHHYRRNRNHRENLSLKAAGAVRHRNIFLRSIEPSDTSVPNVPYDKIQRKPPSFIQSMRDYILSILREGTRWAKRYIYQSFKSGNKSEESSRSPRREGRRTDFCSSSNVIEAGQRDHEDKSREGYKTNHNRRGDENSVTVGGSSGDTNGENTGNSQTPLNGRHRNERSGDLLNKRGQARSQSCRKWRKREGPVKRITCNVVRYNKVGKKVHERDSFHGNGIFLIDMKEPNGELRVKNCKDTSNKGETNSDENNEEIGTLARGDKRIIHFGQSMTLEKGKIKPSRIDESSKPSTRVTALKKTLKITNTTSTSESPFELNLPFEG